MSFSLDEITTRFLEKSAEVALDGENDRLIVDARDSLVADDDISLLGDLQNLVYLNLSGSMVTNFVIPQFARHKRLEFLDLGRTNCDERCIGALVGCQELRGLGLSGMRITTEVLKLLHVRKLELLDLSSTGVTKDAVRTLLQSSAICNLNLSGNEFHPSDFTELDILEEDSRTVVLEFGKGSLVGIARPRNPPR